MFDPRVGPEEVLADAKTGVSDVRFNSKADVFTTGIDVGFVP